MLQRSTSTPETAPPASQPGVHWGASRRWGKWLDGAIYFFLCLFVILLPHSIKGSNHAWQIALILWLVKLVVERKRPFPQPLSAPLLAYLVLSAISTLLSPDPYLSWAAMKRVCLVIVIVIAAQNLTRLSQVRTLVFLLLLSGLAAAGFTAWQYVYGIGLEVKNVSPDTALYRAGVRDSDVITRVNQHGVHSPAQMQSALEQCSSEAIVPIDFLRGSPLLKRKTFAACEGLRSMSSGTQSLEVVRAKPLRAQGTLRHYIIFAETLMLVGCLAWAMFLSTEQGNVALRAFFAAIFLSFVVTVLATQTRAAIVGLAVGCFVALELLAGKRTRIWASIFLGVLLVVATVWIWHTRGLDWIGAHDAGTHYRLLMWEDGVRLIRQHPWFGVGMETIFNHWQEWNIRAYALYHEQWHFHSDIMQLAVERGLLTLAAWLWFVVASLIFLRRLIGRVAARSRFATGAVAGALAAFAAFLVQSLVEYSLNNETVVMLLFLLLGMAIAIDHLLDVPGAIDIP